MYYLGVGDYKLGWFTDIYVGLVGKAEAWFGIPASGDLEVGALWADGLVVVFNRFSI